MNEAQTQDTFVLQNATMQHVIAAQFHVIDVSLTVYCSLYLHLRRAVVQAPRTVTIETVGVTKSTRVTGLLT